MRQVFATSVTDSPLLSNRIFKRSPVFRTAASSFTKTADTATTRHSQTTPRNIQICAYFAARFLSCCNPHLLQQSRSQVKIGAAVLKFEFKIGRPFKKRYIPGTVPCQQKPSSCRRYLISRFRSAPPRRYGIAPDVYNLRLHLHRANQTSLSKPLSRLIAMDGWCPAFFFPGLQGRRWSTPSVTISVWLVRFLSTIAASFKIHFKQLPFPFLLMQKANSNVA